MATVEFVFNNKIYISTNLLLFKANYGKEPRINFEIRKIRKHAKTEEFVKKMKKIYEKIKVILKKSQKKIKKYTDRNRKKAVKYKVR